ncbi:threonine/serine exporter family protein [Bacillus spongiae]|uniref:Threonine/serine exporter family protein n=1 Tax=Bacillus spongiae TaxID=2683610 RepID=A0ABU8HDS7_9BACI
MELEQDRELIDDVMKVCLLAGKLMLMSGAETYRVEDTMIRIAAAYGMDQSHSYVTPTGIIFSLEGLETTETKLIRIVERSTDLKQVTVVNSISRQISGGEMTVSQAYERLKEVEQKRQTFSLPIQTVAAAVIGGCFVIMFQGNWHDFIPAFLAGGVGFYSFMSIHKVIEIKFFAEFLASVFIGLLANVFVLTGIGQELDKIIIGSVMPLVPGLLITNAVRDLMAGHLVSGLSKGAEAFLTAFAIGSGIAVVFTIM